MNRFTQSISNLFTLVVLTTSGATLLGAPEQQATDYFNFIERVTRFSPLEHAGSHGTIGIGLGLGMSVHESASDQDVMRAHWRRSGSSERSSQSPSGKIYIPRAYFHKGLPWAMDLGVSYGQDPVSQAVLAAAYAQWTMFEGFALPALAVRGGVSRLMGLATTDSSVLSADLVASHGFLRFVTIYGSIGRGRYQTRVRSGDSYGTTLALSMNEDGDAERVSSRLSRSLGVQFQILPPFWTAAIESSQTGSDPTSFLGKISVGM
jgi:hypothetical protein